MATPTKAPVKPAGNKPTKEDTKGKAATAKDDDDEDEDDEKKTPQKRASSMTEEEKKAKINELLEQLANTDDQSEKRKTRAKLRALGHRGGLPKKPKEEKPEGDKKNAKPAKGGNAGKRAASPKDEDEDEDEDDDD